MNRQALGPALTVPIVAINRRARTFLLEDGITCRMVTLFDRFGDETDDSAAAVSAVGPLPDGRWAAIVFSDFEPPRVH